MGEKNDAHNVNMHLAFSRTEDFGRFDEKRPGVGREPLDAHTHEDNRCPPAAGRFPHFAAKGIQCYLSADRRGMMAPEKKANL